MILGSDGYFGLVADPGTSATLNVSTAADGSPGATADAVTYTVTYEIESPQGSGQYVAGDDCVLVTTWAPPSCEVNFDPATPVPGAAAEISVVLRNAHYDGVNGRFGVLTSDAAGWTADVQLAAGAPGLTTSANAVQYDPAFTWPSWNAPQHEGLYQVAVPGPGTDNASECARRAGETPTGIHTSDRNENHRIDLTELLRVIQFYNSGGFQCAAEPGSTEDGYVPGAGGNQGCSPHDSDYNPGGPDWDVDIVELLRIIQFYNSGGYHYCPGDGTEDDYCPGLVN